MRLAIRALPLVVILSMSAAGFAEAAVEVFLCADPDIVGDSRDTGHVGSSDAISVAQQVAVNPQPPPGAAEVGASTAGKRSSPSSSRN